MGWKGPPCQSLGGEGAAKALYLPLVLVWESQCTGHVTLTAKGINVSGMAAMSHTNILRISEIQMVFPITGTKIQEASNNKFLLYLT